MALERNEIEKLLKKSFPSSIITINDIMGDQDHWEVKIISNLFKGKNKLEQHKMVYKSLEGKAGNEIHALKIKTSCE